MMYVCVKFALSIVSPTGLTVRQLCANFKPTVGGYKESWATVIIMYETACTCQATVIIIWDVCTVFTVLFPGLGGDNEAGGGDGDECERR